MDTGGFSSGSQPPECESDHSPTHTTDVNNACSYTSIQPYAKLRCLTKHEVSLLLSKNKQFL